MCCTPCCAYTHDACMQTLARRTRPWQAGKAWTRTVRFVKRRLPKGGRRAGSRSCMHAPTCSGSSGPLPHSAPLSRVCMREVHSHAAVRRRLKTRPPRRHTHPLPAPLGALASAKHCSCPFPPPPPPHDHSALAPSPLSIAAAAPCLTPQRAQSRLWSRPWPPRGARASATTRCAPTAPAHLARSASVHHASCAHCGAATHILLLQHGAIMASSCAAASLQLHGGGLDSNALYV